MRARVHTLPSTMNVFAVYSLFLLCLLSVVASSPLHLPSSVSDKLRNVGDPLLLTSYIEAGKVEEARKLSRVEPFVEKVDSYAGFLTVNETAKSHLYFWFFPKTGVDKGSTPLILWLQGGPGASSLYGVFNENGPYQVTKEGGVERRVQGAWTDNYHMLYIDQPVGTGFSFSESEAYVTTEVEVAEHLYAALLQFYELFPELKKHDFYVAGESYAGKYVPAIGHKIHTVNQQSDHHQRVFNVPLKGLLIGNGFSDPENMLDFAVPLQLMGLIDAHDGRKVEEMQRRTKYLIQSGDWFEAFQSRVHLFEFISKVTNLSSLFDYRSDESLDDSYADFVSKASTREMIHVGGVPFNESSRTVFLSLGVDNMQSIRPWIEELLEYYPMLFFNGQFDIRCAHWLTEYYLDKLDWSGAANFGQATMHIWRVDGKVAGYYKSSSNLVYTMVRNAGHMVPIDQPKNALNLVDMFVAKKLFNK